MLTEEPGNPYLRANSLAELLSWNDVEFVRCAYVTVLGRQPDPEGEAHYTRKIRQGRSKLQVLWELRRSSEGPRHDPGIAGFDRALKKWRWERGWLGWLIRPATRGEGDGPAWRRHRIVVNEIGRSHGLRSPAGDPNLVAEVRHITDQLGELAKAVARLSAPALAQTPASAHAQLLENPDYRHLSARSQKIFREIHARSH